MTVVWLSDLNPTGMNVSAFDVCGMRTMGVGQMALCSLATSKDFRVL